MEMYTDILTGDVLVPGFCLMREVDDVMCVVIPTKAVVDVLNAGCLNGTDLDKESYVEHLADYLKRIKDVLEQSNPGRVPAFEKGAAAFAKKVVDNFQEYGFFTGDSTDGMVILLKEDSTGLNLFFWKDGLGTRERSSEIESK